MGYSAAWAKALFYSSWRRKDCVMKGFLKKAWCFVKLAVPAIVCGTVLVIGGGEVFAQTTPPSVQFTELVQFDSTMWQTITAAVGAVVAAALGLGLGIWAARYIFGIIRSMGR